MHSGSGVERRPGQLAGALDVAVDEVSVGLDHGHEEVGSRRARHRPGRGVDGQPSETKVAVAVAELGREFSRDQSRRRPQTSPPHPRRPRTGRPPLEEFGPIRKEGYERTRATALDVIRATEVHRYEVVVVENVVEFAVEWELFDWWRQGMHLLGYTSQVVSVSSAHIGDQDNAPAAQWRDRIFIIFTRAGVPIPKIAPRPLAWCSTCGQDVEAVQAWRNGSTIGKYRQQYDYRCHHEACRHQIVEPYVAPAASIIDWTSPGIRIGDRAAHGLRPLAAKTRQRIEAGLREHGPLITLAAAGNTFERTPGVRTWPAGHPLRTLSTSAEFALAADVSSSAFLFSVNHDGPDPRALPASHSPLPPRTVRTGDGLVVPIRTNGTAVPAGSSPCLARTATSTGQALLTPAEIAASFVAELRGGGSSHRPVLDPFATFSASGRHHGLVIPYRKARTTTTYEPLHTLSTIDSAGLAHPGADAVERLVEVDDCHFRMITPRESLSAQRFPDGYVVHGNQGEQTMQAGNAVSVNVARWIGTQITVALNRRKI